MIEYFIAEEVSRPPYHKRPDPFSTISCDSRDTVVPFIQLPHDVTSMWSLRNWCSPVAYDVENMDLIGEAMEVTNTVEAITETTLVDVFGEGLDAQNPIPQSVGPEVLHFQRWPYWRYMSRFDENIILLAQLGLTFWKVEEDWAISWLESEGLSV